MLKKRQLKEKGNQKKIRKAKAILKNLKYHDW